MNISELERLLKSAPIPDRPGEFWEQLPKRITARLHWQEKRVSSAVVEPRRFPRLAWALCGGAVCLIVAFVLLNSSDRTNSASANQVAQAEKCFREIESLFPNQVRAVVFDETGPRLDLAETADVPKSPPLYLKICGPNGCQRIVTFSGQQIRVNGDKCDVLTDGAGNVLVVGKPLVWSSASGSQEAGQYRIRAQPLGISS